MFVLIMLIMKRLGRLHTFCLLDLAASEMFDLAASTVPSFDPESREGRRRVE